MYRASGAIYCATCMHNKDIADKSASDAIHLVPTKMLWHSRYFEGHRDTAEAKVVAVLY